MLNGWQIKHPSVFQLYINYSLLSDALTLSDWPKIRMNEWRKQKYSNGMKSSTMDYALPYPLHLVLLFALLYVPIWLDTKEYSIIVKIEKRLKCLHNPVVLHIHTYYNMYSWNTIQKRIKTATYSLRKIYTFLYRFALYL